MFFITIVFLFPATPNPTAQTMNYTAVVLGGWLLLSLIFYYFPVVGGVHWFRGPIANIVVGEPSNRSLTSTEKEKAGSEMSGPLSP
jgi:hypothetical protein